MTTSEAKHVVTDHEALRALDKLTSYYYRTRQEENRHVILNMYEKLKEQIISGIVAP